MCIHFVYTVKKIVTVFDVFHVLIGLVIVEETVFVQGNTIVSHFVVQRAD